MALELPGYLIPAFDELDLPWPGINEDQLHQWATGVRDFAEDMTRASGRVRQTVTGLAEESESSFANALADYWDEQDQLVNGLTGPLDEFVGALDAAVSQVEDQKRLVINAATELASQLTAAAQAPPATTPAAKQAAQTAKSQQLDQARQTVSAALKSLEASLSGPLLGTAVPQARDYANGLAANLRDAAVPAAGAVETLRLSFGSLHDTAQTIRGEADATDKSGANAYSRNAHRDLRDSSAGVGDPVGDGGSWRSVLHTNIKALAMAVAAATAHGVTFPARFDGAATLNSEDTQVNAEQMLAPLLKYANFPPRVLATLAYEASQQLGNVDPYAPAIWTALLASPQALKLFAGKYANLPPQELATLGKQALTYTYPPNPLAPPPTVIWAALAANPEAANLIVRENAGAIPSFVSGSTQSELPGDQASLFAGVIKAATIGTRDTNSQHAAQAVSDLVMAYKQHPDQHAPAPIEAEYGDIVKAYWRDLQFELTNMTGVDGKMKSPDGMTLTLADWSPFLDEALRNPTTAWSVLQFGHTQAYQFQLKAGEYDGDTGDVYMWDKGFIDGYLDYQAKKVYTNLYQEDQANAASWKSQLQTSQMM